MAARDAYRSLADLSRSIVVLLWLDIACNVAYVLTTLALQSHRHGLIAELGPDAPIDPGADMAPAEILQLLIVLLMLVLMVTLIVMICRWTYRAAWNVRHLGAKGLGISPGMAVGWYFVPFANLVMPFRALREIWLASHDPASWRDQSVGLISGWWGLWLGSNFVGNIATRAALSADTLHELYLTEYIGLIGILLAFGATLMFMRVVRGVQQAQSRAESRLSQPPPLVDPEVTVQA